MSKYIPDENGELTALDNIVISTSETTMPVGELGSALGKMLLTLIALVALLLISYWFVKKLLQNRLQKGNTNATIQVLEKRMISSKTMLYLIEVEGKKILVAESHLEVKHLANFKNFESQHAEYADPSSSQ